MTLPNGLEVWWDGETRAVVHSPAGFSDSIRGLCGNNNNNQRDDFQTPEGDIETVCLSREHHMRRGKARASHGSGYANEGYLEGYKKQPPFTASRIPLP